MKSWQETTSLGQIATVTAKLTIRATSIYKHWHETFQNSDGWHGTPPPTGPPNSVSYPLIKLSINSPGVLFTLNPFEGGLNRDRGLIWEGGGLFYVEKMTVSVLNKELGDKAEKLKYKKLEVMQPRIKNKSELPVGKYILPTANYNKLWNYHNLIIS